MSKGSDARRPSEQIAAAESLAAEGDASDADSPLSFQELIRRVRAAEEALETDEDSP